MNPVRKSSGGMKPLVVSKKSIPGGLISLSGDKSIAHRAIILSALAKGKTQLQNFPIHQDSLATINVFRRLGVSISPPAAKVEVFGRGLAGLRRPDQPIFVNDSGTTLRLLTGLLAGQDFDSSLAAGPGLGLRPMKRVNLPLRLMGAEISAKIIGPEEYPPINIKGKRLKAITYSPPHASAQVKSALLLAGLFAGGLTQVIEPIPTRDHTERMLRLFGVKIKSGGNRIALSGNQEPVSPGKIFIPGDISSAAFFMVLAAIIPGAKIRINKISLNPTRCGVIDALRQMQADIKVIKTPVAADAEPLGDILVKGSKLKGVTVEKQKIPTLIDELPVLMVAAALAQGRTVFEGVEELRVKETDRIASMVQNLNKMGADITAVDTGSGENIVVNGVSRLSGASVKSFGDHRTAMSMIVAGLSASGRTSIDDVSCVKKSFPDCIEKFKSLLEDSDF